MAPVSARRRRIPRGGCSAGSRENSCQAARRNFAGVHVRPGSNRPGGHDSSRCVISTRGSTTSPFRRRSSATKPGTSGRAPARPPARPRASPNADGTLARRGRPRLRPLHDFDPPGDRQPARRSPGETAAPHPLIRSCPQHAQVVDNSASNPLNQRFCRWPKVEWIRGRPPGEGGGSSAEPQGRGSPAKAVTRDQAGGQGLISHSSSRCRFCFSRASASFCSAVESPWVVKCSKPTATNRARAVTAMRPSGESR